MGHNDTDMSAKCLLFVCQRKKLLPFCPPSLSLVFPQFWRQGKGDYFQGVMFLAELSTPSVCLGKILIQVNNTVFPIYHSPLCPLPIDLPHTALFIIHSPTWNILLYPSPVPVHITAYPSPVLLLYIALFITRPPILYSFFHLPSATILLHSPLIPYN